jgi:hypothetical protein
MPIRILRYFYRKIVVYATDLLSRFLLTPVPSISPNGLSPYNYEAKYFVLRCVQRLNFPLR